MPTGTAVMVFQTNSSKDMNLIQIEFISKATLYNNAHDINAK